MSDSEVRAVIDELGKLMDELRGSVSALQAILTSPPEVNGDQPAAAV